MNGDIEPTLSIYFLVYMQCILLKSFAHVSLYNAVIPLSPHSNKNCLLVLWPKKWTYSLCISVSILSDAMEKKLDSIVSGTPETQKDQPYFAVFGTRQVRRVRTHVVVIGYLRSRIYGVQPG